jgi:hypothetical protein
MPLVDVPIEMGALTFASKSHTEGFAGNLAISDDSHSTLEELVKQRGYAVTNQAMKAGDASKAEATRSALTGITEVQIVPLHALALSEGLTEAQFQRRYTSTESPEYAAMVEKIDRVLKGQE